MAWDWMQMMHEHKKALKPKHMNGNVRLCDALRE